MQSLITVAKHAPIGAAEVAQRLQVPVSTVYRYLASLRSHGLIWELPHQVYAAGPRCVELGSSFMRTFQQSSYREVMEGLGETVGETVAFLVPQDNEAICIDTIESTLPLRYTFSRGTAKPMLRGASAKAMLPWLDSSWVLEQIAVAPDLTDTEKERLLEELPRIRSQGYAVSLGEVDQGVWAVGAPVYRANGELDGSVSIIAPLFRVQGQEQRFIDLTVAAAAAMTHSNGWECSHDN